MFREYIFNVSVDHTLHLEDITPSFQELSVPQKSLEDLGIYEVVREVIEGHLRSKFEDPVQRLVRIVNLWRKREKEKTTQKIIRRSNPERKDSETESDLIDYTLTSFPLEYS